MPMRWKLLGLAGVAGVAATGVVVARRRRAERPDLTPDELRERLRRRLAEVVPESAGAQDGGSTQPPVSPL